MEKSKVYFASLRMPEGKSALDKLDRLLDKAGFDQIDFDGKFVAIKIHFGEPGNLSFLRPNWARVVADAVKRRGGKPFLTDCNTLYAGRRKNALEHLESAEENGFSPLSTGCQLIIADGLKGTDEALVPLEGTTYVKEAKIGRAIMDADIIISLNHFKGHEATGFGGAMKNLGMGCGSRAGKMEQHNAGKPEVNEKKCRACHACARSCGQDAVDFSTGKAHIDHDKCVGCGRCLGVCNFDAIFNPNDDTLEALCMKMAEYTLAVVKDRPQFHISIAKDISPFCDCYGGNDVPIIPDIGMFASFDPVAIDQACADKCNAETPMADSYLTEMLHKHECAHHDHFSVMHPGTNWEVTLDHAEKLGVGTRQYELIEVK